MASLGLTGLVSMHAPTVRDALQIISNSIQTSNTGVATTLDVRGQIASFLYVVTAPNIESSDQIVDAGIAVIVNTMRQLCGPRLAAEPGATDSRSAARQDAVCAVL